jgi:hypothetical protein
MKYSQMFQYDEESEYIVLFLSGIDKQETSTLSYDVDNNCRMLTVRIFHIT